MGASVRPQLFQRPPGMKLSALKEGRALFVVQFTQFSTNLLWRI
jgi:hypothetical protein